MAYRGYICYNLLHMKKDKLDGDVTLWLQHFALQPSPIAATVVDPRMYVNVCMLCMPGSERRR